MKYKVKYTRKEYREEYLNSEEWKKLRNTILDSCPECQCCGKSASDVHHMVYRNLVDIKVSDLLPVCRSCHENIHEAINYDWISQNPKDLEEIKRKTLQINFDESYNQHRKWMKDRHNLSQEEKDSIKELQGFIIQKISALVRKNVWYDKLDHMKFTGKQILQIRKIIQMGIYRRKEKLDVKKKTIFKKRKYSFNGKQK
jgi:hypothetical protein